MKAMANTDRDQTGGSAIVRVSDALVSKQGKHTFWNRLREIKLWLLLDASRWGLIAGLAVGIYIATIAVGLFGPASVQQYLLDGTSIANAYIELQPGIITAITIVLAINQLVLSPEFGSISHQRERLDDVLSHRRAVEENADIISSPTDPAGFLQTITEATCQHLLQLDEATTDNNNTELRQQVANCAQGIREEIQPVNDALKTRQFNDIELFGAAIHYDTTRDIHRVRRLRRRYEQDLSDAQMLALEDLLTALKQYDVAREYFRTRYLQTQFIGFSRTILLTGLPALMVAHYSVGVIGPDILPGTTFNVQNLLWFEGATFTLIMIPIVVIVIYVARIVTLAQTSIFIGPFAAERSPE